MVGLIYVGPYILHGRCGNVNRYLLIFVQWPSINFFATPSPILGAASPYLTPSALKIALSFTAHSMRAGTFSALSSAGFVRTALLWRARLFTYHLGCRLVVVWAVSVTKTAYATGLAQGTPAFDILRIKTVKHLVIIGARSEAWGGS